MFARAVLLTSSACQRMFCERLSAKCSRPAPIVAFVRRSIRMNAPVSRLVVRVERDRLVEREVADADLVQRERLRGEMLERVDVDLVFRLRDRRGDLLRADLDPVRAPRQHRLVRHPDDRRLELVRNAGQRFGLGEHVAAAHVDLVLERQRDRLAGDCLGKIAVHRHEPHYLALASRRQHADLVAGLHRAAHYRAREPAEVEVGPVDPLHRQPERRVPDLVLDLDGLEVTHQRRAAVPRHGARSAR
jgi:hypothetical protein